MITASLRAAPDIALVYASSGRRTSLSFAELDSRSARVASGLRRSGLSAGDRLLVQLPSSVELMVTVVAALRLGLVIVPLPTAAGTGHLEAALVDSGARAMVVADLWRGTGYQSRLAAAAAAPDLRAAYVVGPAAPADLAFNRLESAPGAGEPMPAVDPDAACALIFTSGSSGRPKGVLHSHNTLATEVRTGWAGQSGETGQRTFVPLPPGHIGGLISTVIPLLTRRPAAYLEPWDRATAIDLIRSTGASIMGAVPFFLIELLDEAVALGSLAFCSIGGAGVPPVLVERADDVGLCVARSYGLTEHPTVTAGTAADPLSVRAHTDGRATAGNRIRIVDPDGRDLPVGEIGEIVTSGPEQMLGYLDPEQDVLGHLPGGWLRTGDLGRLEDDLLIVTGRLKEIVIRGGENIATGDVENILMRHPAVLEAAVVGVSDERYGERLLAVVAPRPGAQLDLAKVQDHFRRSDAGRLLTPEFLDIVAELPRGATGKVERARLREEWEAGR